MSKTQFTPGPYAVAEIRNNHIAIREQVSPDKDIVALIPLPGGTRRVDTDIRANAEFFAAAPETAAERDALKASLESLARDLMRIRSRAVNHATLKNGYMGSEFNEIGKAIDVVIARATGQAA